MIAGGACGLMSPSLLIPGSYSVYDAARRIHRQRLKAETHRGATTRQHFNSSPLDRLHRLLPVAYWVDHVTGQTCSPAPR